MPAGTAVGVHILQWIWVATMTVAVLALCIVAILATLHVRARRASIHAARRRDQLEQLMRGALYSPVAGPPPRIDRSFLPLAFEIALDWLRFIRGTEARRIIEMLQGWRIEAYVAERLLKGTPADKIRALTYYGYCEDRDSLNTLLRTATAESGDIQLGALRALAARSAFEHLPAILPALRREGRATSLLIADVLRRFGEEGVPHIIAAARSASDVEIRCAAILALAAIGAAEATHALTALCRDRDPRVQVCAFDALRRLGAVHADDHIAHALADAHPDVRAAAAAAAGALRIPRLAGRLMAALHDPEWCVRYNAADALRSLGPGGVEILKRIGTQENAAGAVSAQVLAEAAG